ncbi:MAG TPA: NUDIX hydrolase [Rhizomicrobium sp.]
MSDIALDVENLQYAALPWRRSHGALEILLVTTRRTRRWIVPKGWPEAGLLPHQCAAREALEEAGVEGDAAPRPLGAFAYDKHRKSGESLACTVLVFPMEVARQRRNWPEKSARETRWCTTEMALELVGDPGLRRLIAKFAKSCAGKHERHRSAAA